MTHKHNKETIMDLEFFTNEELIEELFNRTTFNGVIVYDKQNRRNENNVTNLDMTIKSSELFPIEIMKQLFEQIAKKL